jgi:hypothetical protein
MADSLNLLFCHPLPSFKIVEQHSRYLRLSLTNADQVNQYRSERCRAYTGWRTLSGTTQHSGTGCLLTNTPMSIKQKLGMVGRSPLKYSHHMQVSRSFFIGNRWQLVGNARKLDTDQLREQLVTNISD